MPQILETPAFLILPQEGIPLLDVRSPGEYRHAHLPAAQSFPLFDDEERSDVGTLYKQVSKDAAMLRGLEIVGPKMPTFLSEALRLCPEKRVGIYCARGGKRSESMAWLLQNAGFEVYLLRGGYKAARRHYLQLLEAGQWPLQVVGGMTGSRKTKVLNALREEGEQVLDLEDLARHRGSAFGLLPGDKQPDYEDFENQIAWQLSGMDPHRPVWVEDESRHIGRLVIPGPLWLRMRQANLYFLDVPPEERLLHILEDYGKLPLATLDDAFRRVRLRMGPQHADAARAHLAAGQLPEAAALALAYYDKLYQHHNQTLSKGPIISLPCTASNPLEIARSLIQISRNPANEIWISTD